MALDTMTFYFLTDCFDWFIVEKWLKKQEKLSLPFRLFAKLILKEGESNENLYVKLLSWSGDRLHLRPVTWRCIIMFEYAWWDIIPFQPIKV